MRGRSGAITTGRPVTIGVDGLLRGISDAESEAWLDAFDAGSGSVGDPGVLEMVQALDAAGLAALRALLGITGPGGTPAPAVYFDFRNPGLVAAL